MSKLKTIITVTLSVAAFGVLAAVTAPVASDASATRGCTPRVVVAYHYQGAVIDRILKGCGGEWAAWGKWAKDGKSDIDTGTFKTSGFMHVCDDPSNCVSHPDGRLREGGWQQEGHPRHCAFGCGAAARTLSHAQHRCTREIDVTWGSNFVQAHVVHPCGNGWRVVGRWQIAGTKYGPWRHAAGTYSVVCAVASNCGNGGGSLWGAGFQRESDHKVFCVHGNC